MGLPATGPSQRLWALREGDQQAPASTGRLAVGCTARGNPHEKAPRSGAKSVMWAAKKGGCFGPHRDNTTVGCAAPRTRKRAEREEAGLVLVSNMGPAEGESAANPLNQRGRRIIGCTREGGRPHEKAPPGGRVSCMSMLVIMRACRSLPEDSKPTRLNAAPQHFAQRT